MTRMCAGTSRTRALVVAGLLSVASTSMGQSAPSGTGADRAQIMAMIDSWEKAWNGHDMHAFASLFHEDGVWILWTGEVWKGRTAIEEGHAAVHKTVFRNSVQRERLEELTFVGPDAAVVRFYSTLTGDERAPDKLIRSRKILIVTKRAATWKIGWGQNTRFADTTPDPQPIIDVHKHASWPGADDADARNSAPAREHRLAHATAAARDPL
jgi:uncharacterized protein (TIGR02246 family)